ncbi:hypothetical protein DY000_02054502 [Brassica cretica]|uniref:FHA domain-containing protein n=1 Tax=Brassica cretica TaxID=69181 RepID=A0ABQ7AKN6_BRACR|nr:hypothetical protein DY000_02054502 [Brassica cretica]
MCCVLRDLCVSLSRRKHFVALSLAPFRRNHRVSLSLLDDSAGDFFICQRSDEGFGVSLVRLVVSVGGLRVCIDGRIKRHEDSSKKRTVVLTDQEIMAISVSGTN